MPVPLVILFAVTIARDAVVRASCEASAEVVAKAPAGTQVEIRFSVADGSSCYKIEAVVGGKTVLGYVSGSFLDTRAFDDQRRAGASLDGEIREQAAKLSKTVFASNAATPQQNAILDLLNTQQPGQALERVEAMLRYKPRDAQLLALASIAAYRSDQLRLALGYCKDGVAAGFVGGLDSFCGKLERETKADQSGEKLYGLRVALRYEGETLPPETARAMVGVLDEELTRVSQQLGCTAKERIVAIVQSRDAYLRTTNAAEWSGGQFDGRIHVSLPEGRQFGPSTHRAFAHEIVHACLANLGQYPAWLHEGLAQKLSGDVLPAPLREELRSRIQSGDVPRLENVSQDWSRMSSRNARLAYTLALAAADALIENYSNYGLGNILRNPQLLQQIVPGLDKALGF